MGRKPRNLEPHRSAAHAFGAELRRLRVERGLSQVGLGELVHHSGALVGKIEKAERSPSEEFCARSDEVLDAGGRLVRLRPTVDPHGECAHSCFIEPSWTVEASLGVLRELTGGSVDRRDFLALTGTVLAATATRWSDAVDRVFVPAPVPHGRLGRASLERLDQRLADLRVLDDELGGTVLRGLAIAELNWLTDLARTAGLGDDEQRRVLRLVTEAARLCGWLHLDANLHAAAQGYYVAALRCSAGAGDPSAGANVLAGMSFQATLTGHTGEAVALVDTAEQHLGRRSSPKLTALLASRRARAHARAGDARACGRALNQAESALERARDGFEEPGWIYFFDEFELAAQAGACWVDLRRPDLARPLLDGALHSLDSQYVRDRTIYHVRSGQTHFHGGDLDSALEELTTAAALAERTGSTRSISTLRDARRDMAGFAAEPVVREFDRTFHGLLEMVG